MTTTYHILDYADAYGATLCEARTLTEEEKVHYVPFWQEHTLIAKYGSQIDLKHICGQDIRDVLKRKPTAYGLPGGHSDVYILTPEEWDALIARDEQNRLAKEEKDRLEEIELLKQRKAKAERQEKLYTPEEAKAKRDHWIAVQNEGGEGYVPWYYTQEEYDRICARLEELTK